jgi:hypothetical protein
LRGIAPLFVFSRTFFLVFHSTQRIILTIVNKMIMRRGTVGLALLLTIFLLIPVVNAHVPITTHDDNTLETAFLIEDPTKSWVVYSDVHEGALPQYFKFEMDAGTRLRFTLAIPVIEDPNEFQPSIALIGPGITNSSSIPDYLEIPESSGVMIFDSGPPVPYYEGFTPTSFSNLIDIDMEAPATGQYYLAVYEPDSGGLFSITLGYVETFNLDEWFLVPFSVMIIHQWNGQGLLSNLAPMIATLVIGMALLINRRDEYTELDNGLGWMGALGALLFFGSGVTIFYQIVLAALFTISSQILVSIMFGILPLFLGFFTIRTVLSENWQNKRSKQLQLLLLGVIAPFLWAGLFVGPALVIASSLIAIVRTPRDSDASPDSMVA